MPTVAKGSVLLTPKFDNLTSSISRQLDGAFAGSSGIGSKAGAKTGAAFSSGVGAKVGAVAGIVSAVTGKAFTAISRSLDSAISRVDTMNNFPKVMAGLGYGADAATSSIDKMSDHLTGLPTRLDAMTSSVQKIVPTVKDVGKATDIMLAFNDALLAGGASTQVQEAALEQFCQVLAKGKPEMEDWRSIVTAMPGQMDQVAKSMLGPTASTNDLYNALKTGKVSVEDLEDAFISLDKNGYAGFDSFAQQAKTGTAGIATSMANLRNSVTKSVAACIDAFGVENITAPIQGTTTLIKNSGDAIAGTIAGIRGTLTEFSGDMSRMLATSTPVSELARNVDILGRCLRGIADDASAAIAGMLPLEDIASSLNGYGLATTVFDIARAINQMIEGAGGITAVCGSLKGFAPAIAPAAAGLTAFIAGGVASGISSIPVLGGLLGGLTGPLSALVGPAGIAAAAFVGLMATSEELRSAVGSAVSGVVQAVVPLGAQIASAVMPVVAALPGLMSSVATALAQVIGPIGQLVQALLPLIPPVIQAICSVLGTAIAIIQQVLAVAAPIVAQVISFVAQCVAVVMPAIQSVLTCIQTAMPLIQAWISAALSVIQAIWNAVWPVMSTVTTSVLSVVSAMVQGTMAVIQAIIQTVMAVIDGDWSGAWEGIQSVVSAIWGAIESVISAYISAVSAVISSVLSSISGVWSSTWGAIRGAFSSIWEGIKSAAQSGVNSVYTTVTGIKDKITGFFAGAGSWLVESGKAILNGLKSGIESAVGAVTSSVSGAVERIRGLFPFSPAKWGPFSGHGYTTYSGRALMGDFGESIVAASAGTAAMASKALARVEDVFNVPTVSFASADAAGARSVAIGSAAPAGLGVVERGDTYYINIDGSLLEVDERIARALKELIAEVKRSSRSRRG